ncbi:VOC family protein [Halobacillus shinanisalinarum]|uniref:VOC family protein n=1 Tax=Halobacillus shinanisalinarum TaxID=2932258 RepID=A0ABY4H2C7_9BACI|nr:VOC family protein [Halobacillus shinanisalinarum]UOQ93127.1 VOC family protein [Halobacillus shinanisalinarum]
MNFREFGLILFVEHYKDCIDFYKEVLNFKVRSVKETLVSFELAHGYLMVEKGGVGTDHEKTRKRNPTVLRFDVNSLSTEVSKLEKRGVHFTNKQLEFPWGMVAVLNDPDGNRIEIGEINRAP